MFYYFKLMESLSCSMVDGFISNSLDCWLHKHNSFYLNGLHYCLFFLVLIHKDK